MDTERLQSEHYDEILTGYEAHYGDPSSQRYRSRFIYDRLFGGVDLAGARVLEAMSGSGQTTGYLLDRGAEVTGLDISASAIRSFGERWPDCDAMCGSIVETGLEAGSFDCVVVVGGLHHLHPHVNRAIDEIHRLLKVGGHFCFVEPHHGSLPDVVRRRWYKHDNLFAQNEASIDVDALRTVYDRQFDFALESYQGNLAYLLVLNSMVFRVPLAMKSLYAPVLMPLESLIERFQGKLLSCYVIGRWQKKEPNRGVSRRIPRIGSRQTAVSR